MDGATTFGDWVKQRRKALGLTQAALAQRVACSKVMITKIEANARRPSRSIAELLAQQLKIAPVDYTAFMHLACPDLSPELLNLPSPTLTPQLAQSPAKPRRPLLPIPPTPLIGREAEVAQLSQLLRQETIRLVTLIGPGGTGKTRLGLEIAARLQNEFADGVYFVNLAPLSDPDLVIPTMAQTLGLQESRSQPVREGLWHYLSDQHLLVLLDNFEQVLAAAKEIAQCLSLAPGLKIVVTSRAVLHLSGEQVFNVPPLELPDLSRPPVVKDLAQAPAVALFVQRAQSAKADFALTPENAPAVAQICAYLNGLPLAIELAAARSKVLSPHHLLERLTGTTDSASHFELLASGAQDLPARQQTLRRTMDWSYDLLSEREQTLFRGLSVFVGGWTLEAAEAVWSEKGKRIWNGLTALLDQSLIRSAENTESAEGEPRFQMLEMVRHYALERLIARGEQAALQQHHAAYYLALVEEAEKHFQGAEQELWLKRLEAEHANVRAALAWSYGTPAGLETGLRLVGGLWQFWLIRGYLSEGRTWLSNFLARSENAALDARAKALNGAGLLAWAQADSEQATVWLEESLRLFRKLGDKRGSAWVLNHQGQVAQAQGNHARAAALFATSLRLSRELGADWNSAWTLSNLGDFAYEAKEYALAVARHTESLELFRKLGDPRGSAWALHRLGRVTQSQNDPAQAAALFNQSLSLFREVGDKSGLAWSLNHLGQCLQTQGELAQAAQLFQESLSLFRALGATWNVAWLLNDLAQVALAQQDYQHAETQHHEALKLFLKMGDERGRAWTLHFLGQVAQAQKQMEAATDLFNQSLELFQSFEDQA